MYLTIYVLVIWILVYINDVLSTICIIRISNPFYTGCVFYLDASKYLKKYASYAIEIFNSEGKKRLRKNLPHILEV